MSQPPLQRPKSKLRLRLGLTPPHPRPAPLQVCNQNIVRVPATLPSPSPPPTSLLAAAVNDLTLAESTNSSRSGESHASGTSGTSGTSRPDSTILFPFDSSPSTANDHTTTTFTATGANLVAQAAFDTVSYTSVSPSSVAFDWPIANPYPTPSSSEADETEVEVDGNVPVNNSSPNRQSRIHPHHRTHSRTDSLSHRVITQFQAQAQSHFSSPRAGQEQLNHRTFNHEADPQPTASLAQYPGIRAAVQVTDDVFWLADYQLADRFKFVKELGFGNWGIVWLAKPMHPRASHRFLDSPMSKSARAVARLGRSAATSGGSGAGGKVAIKLVHRTTEAETPYRVKALWEEMKITRSLRQEPHPSIIQYEAFCISPSFAVVIMPYLSHLIQLPLSPSTATPYLRQLASAIGYLHERGITHNDIKPANIMISHADIPVLIDFGFAHKWEIGARGSFFSSVAWGTPEYLEPLRAKSLPHDERTTDIWSLGITFYEILIGRTPFEIDEEEEFATPEDHEVYYQRTVDGEWLGEWYMPEDLQHLIRFMLHPNPAMRIPAMQVYHHPALQPSPPSVLITPHFIRAATSFEVFPIPMDQGVPDVPETRYQPDSALSAHHTAAHEHVPTDRGATKGDWADTAAGGEKKRTKKKQAVKYTRAATPALGESIKQHTTQPRPRAGDGDADTKKGSKLVLKKMRSNEDVNRPPRCIEDPTRELCSQVLRERDQLIVVATKINKPARELPVKDVSAKEKRITLRASQKHLRAAALARPTSSNSLRTTTAKAAPITTIVAEAPRSSVPSKENARPPSTAASALQTDKSLPKRAFALSLVSSSTTTVDVAANKEQAQLHTMQSLEGIRSDGAKKRDVLAAITRPAPEPPRPVSDSVTLQGKACDEELQRRSLGVQRTLDDMSEENTGELARPLAARFTADQERPVQCLGSGAEGERYRTAYSVDQSQIIHSPRIVSSPPKKRLAKPAIEAESPARDGRVVNMGSPPRLTFPSSVGSAPSPLGDLREKILRAHDNQVGRFRQLSGYLVPAQFTPSTSVPTQPETTAPTTLVTSIEAGQNLAHRRSVEALALDSRLDKISEWVKNVELIVEGARKALAEGKDLPPSLLTLPTPGDLAGLGIDIPGLDLIAPAIQGDEAKIGIVKEVGIDVGDAADVAKASEGVHEAGTKECGASPRTGFPAHLRTSSTQVEPATPPKWMTYAEAEERVKQANAWAESKGEVVCGKRSKKERPSVVNVLKMFGAEKEKEIDDKNRGARSSIAEPNMHIPLKPPAPTLRATPSTPMLRSSTTTSNAATQRLPARRSESNLRASNTFPINSVSNHVSFADLIQQSQFSDDEDDDVPMACRPGSPRSPRRLYERFLDSTPGVVRQGDGWSSLSSGRALAKPSSMASLRERARVLLGGGGERGRENRMRDSVPRAEARETIAGNDDTAGGGGRKIVDLSAFPNASETTGSMAERRTSREMLGPDRPARPATPGAASVLTFASGTGTATAGQAGAKGWGIWKGLKGLGKREKERA